MVPQSKLFIRSAAWVADLTLTGRKTYKELPDRYLWFYCGRLELICDLYGHWVPSTQSSNHPRQNSVFVFAFLVRSDFIACSLYFVLISEWCLIFIKCQWSLTLAPYLDQKVVHPPTSWSSLSWACPLSPEALNSLLSCYLIVLVPAPRSWCHHCLRTHHQLARLTWLCVATRENGYQIS